MCCVTLSDLFAGETIGDTGDLQRIMSLLHAFHANFKLWLVSHERNSREPNSEVYKIFVCVMFSALFLIS